MHPSSANETDVIAAPAGLLVKTFGPKTLDSSDKISWFLPSEDVSMKLNKNTKVVLWERDCSSFDIELLTTIRRQSLL